MVYFVIGFIQIILALGTLFILFYFYLTKHFNFWETYKVKGPKPLPICGNFKDVFLGKSHIGLLLKRYYDDYSNEPYIGVYEGDSPLLILRDPEIIKDVLIKDFNYFPNRAIYTNHEKDPWALNLLNLEYKNWRPLRKYLSSAFTDVKLKNMFYLLSESAKNFEIYAENVVKKGEPIECRKFSSIYTTNTISVCAFGLDTTTSENETNRFQQFGQEYLDCDFKNATRRLMREYFPGFYFLLEPLIRSDNTKFLMNSLQETIEYRSKMNIKRNDFVDLLIDLRNHPEKLNDIEISDLLLTSQAFIFFIAGYETSAASMSNLMYELALNPQYQSKLRQEITKTLATDGEFTYDNLKSMKYLDKLNKESLRKYPPGTHNRRISVAPYTFASTNLTIPENTKVIVPVWAIHRDPAIYPDPEVFDPERFNEENEESRHPMHYIPFSHGPHNCIGLRFADIQIKLGIAMLLSKFKFELCDKTCKTYEIHPRSVIPMTKDDYIIKIYVLEIYY
ncbi:cytochrome P450 6B5-like [Phymastichus coffea]|uniref:cytochrome P450 6B5-like n=1 Tax=Phymastichus coffea TaxID=108790 RepID=UPI00273BDE00|nr:cytochrome P450 6B5-like [Phymastichus coffea]XP_058793300.1 cytochrome P450 6B5-like [Phymastichus coffea]